MWSSLALPHDYELAVKHAYYQHWLAFFLNRSELIPSCRIYVLFQSSIQVSPSYSAPRISRPFSTATTKAQHTILCKAQSHGSSDSQGAGGWLTSDLHDKSSMLVWLPSFPCQLPSSNVWSPSPYQYKVLPWLTWVEGYHICELMPVSGLHFLDDPTASAQDLCTPPRKGGFC